MKIIPKKSLGQNFLINAGVLDKIIKAAEIKIGDLIIEVGPGTGNLTKKLLSTGVRVIAIEKDHRLIADLEKEFNNTNVKIIEADVLNFDIRNYLEFGASDLELPTYKVIGNLPYYITSHFLRQVLSEWPTPKLLVLMVQKEVARRIMSRPPIMNPVRGKTPEASANHALGAGWTSNGMNLLALSVQYYADPEIISYVSKGSFRPEPNVDSAVIKLIPKPQRPLSTEKEELFFRILKTAFAGKRKQLATTLPHVLPQYTKEKLADLLLKVGIDPQDRPETVDMPHWIMFVEGL